MASKMLSKEVKGLAIVVILVVVFSIVLVKFKDIDGTTTEINSSIDEGVTALQEPIAWIAIIIIIVVVAWLLSYLGGKKGGL